MTVANVFCDRIHNQLKVLYGNWEPLTNVELGDYGLLQGNTFVKQANITRFPGVTFGTSQGEAYGNTEFLTDSSGSIGLTASATAPKAKAAMKIGFSWGDHLFISANGCHKESIADKIALGDSIKKLIQGGQWKQEYFIVTDIVKAEKLYVYISSGSGANVGLDLEDSTGIGNFKLSNLSLKAQLQMQNAIGFQLTGEKSIPFIGLCKLRPSGVLKTRLALPEGDLTQIGYDEKPIDFI